MGGFVTGVNFFAAAIRKKFVPSAVKSTLQRDVQGKSFWLCKENHSASVQPDAAPVLELVEPHHRALQTEHIFENQYNERKKSAHSLLVKIRCPAKARLQDTLLWNIRLNPVGGGRGVRVYL